MKKLYKNKSWLETQYLKNKKSTPKIAARCNCTAPTVRNWLKKFHIPVRSPCEAIWLVCSNHVNLIKRVKEFLEGELLGDGHLGHQSKRSSFYSHSSKSKRYLEWLSEELWRYGIEKVGKKRIYVRESWHTFPNRGNKLIYDVTFFYGSRSYVELKALWAKWYLENPIKNVKPAYIKIIPPDLELTPLVCRQWYIGDGSFSNEYRYITLNTQCFAKGDEVFHRNDIDLLVFKLRKLGFKITRQANNIHICTQSAKSFLDYIGPCPEAIKTVYGYKWGSFYKAHPELKKKLEEAWINE